MPFQTPVFGVVVANVYVVAVWVLHTSINKFRIKIYTYGLSTFLFLPFLLLCTSWSIAVYMEVTKYSLSSFRLEKGMILNEKGCKPVVQYFGKSPVSKFFQLLCYSNKLCHLSTSNWFIDPSVCGCWPVDWCRRPRSRAGQCSGLHPRNLGADSWP